MKYKLAIAITVPIFFVLVTVCVAASGIPSRYIFHDGCR